MKAFIKLLFIQTLQAEKSICEKGKKKWWR